MQHRFRHSPPIGPRQWHNKRERGGFSLAIVALTIDYYAFSQFDFKFKLPSTKSVILHWGDGTSEEVVGEDATLITKTSSYSEANTYKFWLSGDVTKITYIYLDNIFMDTTCDMSRWSALTSLTDLTILNTITLSGALPASLTYLHLDGDFINWTYSGALPTGLTYLHWDGDNINWTYNGALPAGLTHLHLDDDNVNWTYSGALPIGLTHLYFKSDIINWTYSGALPTDLTVLCFFGNNINWTYNGALPAGLTYLHWDGDNINWTYNGALPIGIASLRFNGPNINWTGLDIGDTGDIDYFGLLNYRIAKMSSADMVTLLTQMTNRTGSLPATVTINDYADYASPPSEVTDAVAALKTAKSITAVTLGS